MEDRYSQFFHKIGHGDRPRGRGWAGWIALAGVILGLTAVTVSQPANRTAQPISMEFATDPLHVESMGLTMLLPVGASSQSVSVGTVSTIRILAAPEEGQKPGESAWMMDIQTIGEIPDQLVGPGAAQVEPTQALTNTVMADRTIKEIQKSYGKSDGSGNVVETKARLLFREQNLRIQRGESERTWSAERFYISFPAGSGADERVVRGTTICQVNPGRFITFSLFVREDEFIRVRPLYEAMVASATLSDPAEKSLARSALIQAGKQVLAGLSEADYRSVIAARGERWDRLYKPAPGGDDSMAIERGYRRTRVWLGQKGELDPSRDRAKWKKSEEAEGYLVSVEYRLLASPESPPPDGAWSMSDAAAIYFMTPDNSDEMWVVRQTDRGPAARPGTRKETGARADGNKMGVTIEGPGMAPIVIKPMFNADGYISQVQTFLLPQLLVRAGAAADYGFYCYQSSSQKVQLRTDSLRRPSDLSGHWELEFRLTEDSPALKMLLNSEGELIRSDLTDGWVWEPTTKERLVSLWQRKGLPMN
jgi:hypothetical protein